MDTQTMIAAVFILLLAGTCLLISIRSWNEKGFLFNNTWIWAAAAQRKKLNKKLYYRQSAVVFAILSAVFVSVFLNLVTCSNLFMWLSVALCGAAVVYAVVSEIRIKKSMEDNHNA